MDRDLRRTGSLRSLCTLRGPSESAPPCRTLLPPPAQSCSCPGSASCALQQEQVPYDSALVTYAARTWPSARAKLLWQDFSHCDAAHIDVPRAAQQQYGQHSSSTGLPGCPTREAAGAAHPVCAKGALTAPDGVTSVTIMPSSGSM